MVRNLQRTIMLVFVVSAAGCSDRNVSAPAPNSQPEAALSSGNSSPQTNEIQLIAERMNQAKVAAQRGDSDGALRYYLMIPRDGSSASLQAALAAAELQEVDGRLHDAILSNEYVLQREASNLKAVENLARLYTISGQRIKAERLLLKLSRISRLSFEQLVLLTDFDRRHPSYAAILEEYESKQPDDLAVKLGLAVEEFAIKDLVAARKKLESIILTNPQLPVAQGLLGEILVDTNPAELSRWYERVPADVRTSAEVQFACGCWARAANELEIAARCFWESARIAPTSYRIQYVLAGVLTDNNADAARHYRNESETIFQLRKNLSNVLNSGGKDTFALKTMIELLVATGRQQEAWCWLGHAQEKHPDLGWVPTMLKTTVNRQNAMSRFLEGYDITKKYPLDTLPPFKPLPSISSQRSSELEASAITFADEAEELGVRFEYEFGRPANSKEVRMFESTGGGIGVLDFDNDGRPDLFFTQGLEWPSGREEPLPSDKYTDVLYRNTGVRFEDISQLAELKSDSSYGQGCAAGDINNDGFQDLYVANIGLNRLFLNNGDGTFTDFSHEAGFTTSLWTTSCLIADIDSDGNPDLFDVNYLQGIRVFRDTCNAHACSTAPFDGAPDEVHWSIGDGSYEHVTRTDEGKSGPGLGIVAFHMSGNGTTVRAEEDSKTERPAAPSTHGQNETQRGLPLALYIGNDGKPDFLLMAGEVNFKTSETASLRNLLDYGFERGLAVNSQGKNTSSMGIASGDINADGKLDFLVTNYSGEPNTLHVQQAGEYFVDTISGTGLYQPGLPYIGWGTQFIDADNDGKKDIIVLNGHVANFQTPGVEYNMPTHLFRQTHNFQFDLLQPESPGPFFTRKILGRSLVTLDWNLDGRRDLVVGTLESPAALLTNTTGNSGAFLSVRLHAVSTARDAIGAVVTVVTDRSEFRSELTAGDGFHASQERCLHFGLGTEPTSILRVSIEWPGGSVQTLQNVPVNSILEVTETNPSALVWQDGAPRSFTSSHQPL